MVKKLKVWLNNKLNKCLHCTVVIKFYRTFVTKLVFTFFVFKYQNPLEQKILGEGDANQKVFHEGGIDILISGTTH